jgi:adenylate kinase
VGLRAVIVGIPGVGKTTVLEKVVGSYRGARLANFGTIMLEVGRAEKLVEYRDELRKLPLDKQRRLQKAAASKISLMRDRLVVVDTHLFIRTHDGFWPGLPFDVVRALKPTHLILLEASPAEIAKRRATDTTRYRDPATEASLSEELALARSFITACSTITGAPITIVWNGEGMQAEVAQGIARMLEKASP